MAYYKYQTQGKTSANLKEKENQKVSGTMELAPNVSYNIHDVYKVIGLGAIFSGNYKLKKVVKRIDVNGMRVISEAVQISAIQDKGINNELVPDRIAKLKLKIAKR